MPTELPRALLDIRYYEAAQKYLRKLPPKHFMEATPQATQRKITLESLDLAAARRNDFHHFNELLVQYPRHDRKKPGQVVPDNMVVLHDGPLNPEGSYDLPLQPARPFWMLDYVSLSSRRRKDYDDNMDKYEHQLQVPYYLLFQPDVLELTLYHYNGQKYVSVKPNDAERYALPEIELEVALLDGWVRYWHRGELLPLPADMERDLIEMRRQLKTAHAALRTADQALRTAEQHGEQERQARLAVEQELKTLREQMEQLQKQRAPNQG